MLNWKKYEFGDSETYPKEKIKQYIVKTNKGFSFEYWDWRCGFLTSNREVVEFYAEFNEPIKKVEFKKMPAPPAI
jgi:hypothetical protein